ncbi:NUDIX hydrolase [Peptoniphilaceae bacterium SGI.131]
MKEHSAGGVVILDGKILVLKKYYGDWVLPKGKIEIDETTATTAIREVGEETGVRAKIIKKIGFAKYTYQNQDDQTVHKRVDYYLMDFVEGELIPQKEEGFSTAVFLEYNKVVDILKHDSEKNMVINAMKFYKNRKLK